MTNLGYLGVDIVLDRDQGPMIIELNARPGLSIQVANFAGLAPRVAIVEALEDIDPIHSHAFNSANGILPLSVI